MHPHDAVFCVVKFSRSNVSLFTVDTAQPVDVMYTNTRTVHLMLNLITFYYNGVIVSDLVWKIILQLTPVIECGVYGIRLIFVRVFVRSFRTTKLTLLFEFSYVHC